MTDVAVKPEEKAGWLSSPFALNAGGFVASLVGLVASSDHDIRVIGALGLIILPLAYCTWNAILKLRGKA